MPVPASLPPGVPARRLRILLAEDNGTNRLVAVTRLKMMGHRVDAVANGQEAVEAVQKLPYDLVLMDVMMPEMDGLTATRLIRGLPGPVAEIPIVALTANVFLSHQQECVAAGMDGFLGKPIMPPQLAAMLDKAAAGALRPGRDAAPAPAAAAPDTVDEAGFRRLVADVGPELANALLATFTAEARARLAAMREMLARPDWRGLEGEAQALKAAAAAIGLAGLAAQADGLGRGTPPEAAGGILSRLSEAVAASAERRPAPAPPAPAG